MKTLLLAFLLSLSGQGSANQTEVSYPKPWPCDPDASSSRDKRRRPVRLTAGELKKRVTYCKLPPIPPNLRVEGAVVVEVLIGTDGKVQCARALSGHPLLRWPAVMTAVEWTFKPYVAHGKPRAETGYLAMFFTLDKDKAKQACGESSQL